MQKNDLRRSGVTIIGEDQENNSPFPRWKAFVFYRQEDWFPWREISSGEAINVKCRVTFLGHTPICPKRLLFSLMVSGAPLFVFFAFRTGKNSYHFTLSDPIAIQPASRGARAEAIAKLPSNMPIYWNNPCGNILLNGIISIGLFTAKRLQVVVMRIACCSR